LIGLSLYSCGQPKGQDFLEVFRNPGGDYTIRYLSPPWDLVTGAEGGDVLFRIANTAASFVDIDGAIRPKYELHVTVERGANSLMRARADQRSARSRGEEVLVAPRELNTAAGDSGWELLTQQMSGDRRNRRTVYLDHPEGVVRLWFDAVPSLEEAEVDAMVRATEITAGRP